MYSVLYTLPPELWPLIAHTLSRPNLASLTLASSRLLYIIRPVLYRAVELETGHREANIPQTLALLARDKELARCVVELSLARIIFGPRDSRSYTRQRLINLDALRNLVSLQRLTLWGRVFRNTIEQRHFGRVLFGMQLENLTYVAINEKEQWPDDHLSGIRDLKKIHWKATDKCAFISCVTVWRIPGIFLFLFAPILIGFRYIIGNAYD